MLGMVEMQRGHFRLGEGKVREDQRGSLPLRFRSTQCHPSQPDATQQTRINQWTPMAMQSNVTAREYSIRYAHGTLQSHRYTNAIPQSRETPLHKGSISSGVVHRNLNVTAQRDIPALRKSLCNQLHQSQDGPIGLVVVHNKNNGSRIGVKAGGEYKKIDSGKLNPHEGPVSSKFNYCEEPMVPGSRTALPVSKPQEFCPIRSSDTDSDTVLKVPGSQGGHSLLEPKATWNKHQFTDGIIHEHIAKSIDNMKADYSRSITYKEQTNPSGAQNSRFIQTNGDTGSLLFAASLEASGTTSAKKTGGSTLNCTRYKRTSTDGRKGNQDEDAGLAGNVEKHYHAISTPAMDTTEYPQITMNAAAVCTKNDDKDPVILTTPSRLKLNELMESKSTLTAKSSSLHEYYEDISDAEIHSDGKRHVELHSNALLSKTMNGGPCLTPDNTLYEDISDVEGSETDCLIVGVQFATSQPNYNNRSETPLCTNQPAIAEKEKPLHSSRQTLPKRSSEESCFTHTRSPTVDLEKQSFHSRETTVDNNSTGFHISTPEILAPSDSSSSPLSVISISSDEEDLMDICKGDGHTENEVQSHLLQYYNQPPAKAPLNMQSSESIYSEDRSPQCVNLTLAEDSHCNSAMNGPEDDWMLIPMTITNITHGNHFSLEKANPPNVKRIQEGKGEEATKLMQPLTDKKPAPTRPLDLKVYDTLDSFLQAFRGDDLDCGGGGSPVQKPMDSPMETFLESDQNIGTKSLYENDVPRIKKRSRKLSSDTEDSEDYSSSPSSHNYITASSQCFEKREQRKFLRIKIPSKSKLTSTEKLLDCMHDAQETVFSVASEAESPMGLDCKRKNKHDATRDSEDAPKTNQKVDLSDNNQKLDQLGDEKDTLRSNKSKSNKQRKREPTKKLHNPSSKTTSVSKHLSLPQTFVSSQTVSSVGSAMHSTVEPHKSANHHGIPKILHHLIISKLLECKEKSDSSDRVGVASQEAPRSTAGTAPAGEQLSSSSIRAASAREPAYAETSSRKRISHYDTKPAPSRERPSNSAQPSGSYTTGTSQQPHERVLAGEPSGKATHRTVSRQGPSTSSCSKSGKDSSKVPSNREKHPSASKQGTSPNTSLSTNCSAKQKVREGWQSGFHHVSQRKSSSGAEDGQKQSVTSSQNAAGLEHHETGATVGTEPIPNVAWKRQKHSSGASITPLMKKTKNLAKMLTGQSQAIHRDGPRERRHSIGEGYKWAERQPPTKKDGSGRPTYSRSSSLIDSESQW